MSSRKKHPAGSTTEEPPRADDAVSSAAPRRQSARLWPAVTALILLVAMATYAVHNLTASMQAAQRTSAGSSSPERPRLIQQSLKLLQARIVEQRNAEMLAPESTAGTRSDLTAVREQLGDVRMAIGVLDNNAPQVDQNAKPLQTQMMSELSQLERLITVSEIEPTNAPNEGPVDLSTLALKKIDRMLLVVERELADRERQQSALSGISQTAGSDHARWAQILLGLIAAGLVSLGFMHWRASRRSAPPVVVNQRKLNNAIEGLPDGCVLLNQDRNVTAHNSSMVKLLPETASTIEGTSASTLYSQLCHDSTQIRNDLTDWLDNLHADSTSVIEVIDHQNRHLMIRERPTSDGDITATVRDISDIKIASEKLRLATDYDSLTGLPNRALFLRELRSYTQKTDQSIALVICDLRDFRQINDSYGQDVGDQVLVAIAASLFRHMPGDAIIARTAGDEFGVMINPLQNKAVVEAAAKQFLDELKQGLTAANKRVPVRASVGISYGPEHAVSPIELKNTADSACSQAKQLGSNSFAIFDRKLQEDADRGHLIDIGLLSAIEENELDIEYQPQIDIQSDHTAGMEALIRWDNKTLGRVSPAEFIPRAERSGLITELGTWVLKRAIADYQRLESFGMSPGVLSVNISRRQFDNPELTNDIRAIIEATGMNPRLLTLEITETAILDDRRHAETVLGQLHDIGVNLSIDDFGVGYSSFLELRDFPINEVKIDRSFVSNVTTCENSRKIIQAIVSVASAIGAEVVAEGIESRAQFECVRDLGCQRAQGFFLCEPMSPTTIPDVVLGGADMTLALSG